MWRGLANPLRRRILDCLRDGPMATGELSACFPEMSRFAVMQHLGVLEEGGLVIRRRAGRMTINYLNPVPIQQIHDRWVSRYQEPWTETLVSLKEQLEADARSNGRTDDSETDRDDDNEESRARAS